MLVVHVPRPVLGLSFALTLCAVPVSTNAASTPSGEAAPVATVQKPDRPLSAAGLGALLLAGAKVGSLLAFGDARLSGDLIESYRETVLGWQVASYVFDVATVAVSLACWSDFEDQRRVLVVGTLGTYFDLAAPPPPLDESYRTLGFAAAGIEYRVDLERYWGIQTTHLFGTMFGNDANRLLERDYMVNSTGAYLQLPVSLAADVELRPRASLAVGYSLSHFSCAADDVRGCATDRVPGGLPAKLHSVTFGLGVGAELHLDVVVASLDVVYRGGFSTTGPDGWTHDAAQLDARLGVGRRF